MMYRDSSGIPHFAGGDMSLSDSLPSPIDLQTSRDRLTKRGPKQGFNLVSPLDMQVLPEQEQDFGALDRMGKDMRSPFWQPSEYFPHEEEMDNDDDRDIEIDRNRNRRRTRGRQARAVAGRRR